MAIKYICDFCGQEAKIFHKEFSTGEIVCDNCYDHLKNQTWRLAEDPAEIEKAKKEIASQKKAICREYEELSKLKAMDNKMAHRYQNALHNVIYNYNKIVETLDTLLPKGAFWARRKAFVTIDIDRLIKQEEQAAVDVYKETLYENFRDNFKDHLSEDIDFLELRELPTVHLHWDKNN